MPITRKLVAPTDNQENQWLKVDSSKRFIVNNHNDWQFLFGPDSAPSTSTLVLKIAAEFDKVDFNSIRFTAYLYNPVTGSISSAASVTFNVYLVTTPDWTDQLVTSFSGDASYTNYYFKDVVATSLTPIDFFGGDTIMIEAVATRLSETYRDRIYINHLGIYDNVTRLRQDVDFIDITKQDE